MDPPTWGGAGVLLCLVLRVKGLGAKASGRPLPWNGRFGELSADSVAVIRAVGALLFWKLSRDVCP